MSKLRTAIKLKSFLIFSFVVVFASLGHSKELASRLGVGFRDNNHFSLPSVAAFYYPNSDYGIVGAIGIDTEKDAAKTGFQIGVRRIIFKEENMNFFMGGNLAFLNKEVVDAGATSTKSGFELQGVVGGEFFLAGLDSLSFNFETGIAMSSVDKTRFRTLAMDPFKAGIVFYF
jgi:hypothetical protein